MNAWVTFVNTEDYLKGAKVLATCLKKVASKYILLVLIPDTFYATFDTTDETLDNIKYIPIRQLTSDGAKCKDQRYVYCINKIYIWTLVDYDRICWLDSDLLIVKNIDEIFDELEYPRYEIAGARGCRCNIMQNPSLHTLPEECPFLHDDKQYINAGVMVIKPSMYIYNILMEQDYKHPFAEQDTFNIVFKDKIKQISSKYNYLNHLPLAHPDVEQDFSVFHFGYGKPWDKLNLLGSHQEMYDLWLDMKVKI